MADYAYPLKDRFVKIYRIKKEARRKAGEFLLIKEYIHPSNAALKAYIRQIVAKDGTEAVSHQTTGQYLVVINYRAGVTEDCYIEFSDRTLKVRGVDGYELRNKELKLNCEEQIVPEDFDKIRGGKW